jgi:hypothetical protein
MKGKIVTGYSIDTLVSLLMGFEEIRNRQNGGRNKNKKVMNIESRGDRRQENQETKQWRGYDSFFKQKNVQKRRC